jgi:hypothetical protein
MKTFMKLIAALVFVVIVCASFSENCDATVRKRLEIPFSSTAALVGNINGALYVIDSQVIRQYDRSAKVRLSIEMVDSKRYWFSPSGFHYLVSGLSQAELEAPVDIVGETDTTDLREEPDPDSLSRHNGPSGYALYNVIGRRLHTGSTAPGVKFYLSSTGRYLVANSDVGSGVEISIFDSLGAQIGLCHVAGCDTVIFAPNEQGFLVDAGTKGLFHYFFSGDKLALYPSADSYDFSLTGKRVVTFSGGKVSLYNRDTLITTLAIPRPSASKVIYEDSRGRLFVLTKKYLFKVNTLTRVVMMEYGTIGEGRVFTDVAYSPKSDMLALTISVSRGSTVSKDKQSAGYALRVITSDGIEQPFYYILTNEARPGFPRVQMKATGMGALFLAPDRAHNVDW